MSKAQEFTRALDDVTITKTNQRDLTNMNASKTEDFKMALEGWQKVLLIENLEPERVRHVSKLESRSKNQYKYYRYVLFGETKSLRAGEIGYLKGNLFIRENKSEMWGINQGQRKYFRNIREEKGDSHENDTD